MKTFMRFMTLVIVSFILTCCVAIGGNNSSSNDNSGNNSSNGSSSGNSGSGSSGSGSGGSSSGTSDKKTDAEKAVTRSAALDALYDNTTLGEVTLTFTQANWDTLVNNTKSGDKTKYSTCDYKYVKGGQTYEISGIGIKNRGNSSFRAPQKSNGDYQQAHFKCKFSKYTDDNVHQLAKAAKSMNLKYMLSDASYVQEVYSYDLFKRFGVWTSPRCSYTKLYIKIGNNNKLYFGMYKAIENIDKQYIKARIGNGQFSSDEGNLWKCLYQMGGPADLTKTNSSLFGVDTKDNTPVYSLKTNEDDETTKAAAITQFKTFITNLNSKSGSEFKTWIASAFDVDGFLKALAVDVSCGMWDDIWRNFNNYYFYFDPVDKGGKAYFIPYDYDNSLGASNGSLMPHPAEKNPLEWGVDNSVLVKKILDVDEYMTKYKNYLADLASDSKDYLKLSASQSRINAWYGLIEQFCDTSTYDADWHASKDGASDWSMKKGKPESQYNFLTNDNNYFTLRIAAINNALGNGSGGDNGGNTGDEGGDNNDNTVTSELLGYDVTGNNVVFTFNPIMYGLSADWTDSLYIRASFNSWLFDNGNPAFDDAYLMTKNDGVYTLTLPKSDVPKNSEYKYGTEGGDWYGVSNRVSGYEYPSGYGTDNIIIKY